MQVIVQESTKYVSNLYFFIGSSFFIPVSTGIAEWLTMNCYDFTCDLKVILKVLLAVLGIFIIKAGCRELVNEERRFKFHKFV